MTGTHKQFSIWAAAVVVGLGAAFTASGAVEASNGPASCEIVAQKSGGMISIEAVAHGRKATSGSYQLVISGPGTNVNQGGDFEVGAGDKVTLGTAMFSANGRGLDVDLTIKAGGTTSSCSERVGLI